MACLLLAGGPPAAGQELTDETYVIKPSEVAVPQDVPLGSYRRIIHPFENWTLICDENLQAKRKVCNISQSFVDGAGVMVFSWSLAANEDGKPFVILRAPTAVGAGNSISLTFAGRSQPVNVKLEACDTSVCVGYLPVGPILRQQIGKNTTVGISYSTPSSPTISVNAPLKGLATALSAIK